MIKTLEERVAWQNEWIAVYNDRIQHGDGHSGTHVRIMYQGNPPGVVIVPRYSDADLLLLEVERYPIGRRSVEFPRGMCKPGESPEAGARRELLEETGLEAAAMRRLGELYPDSGLLMTRAEVFVAELGAASSACLRLEEAEGIQQALTMPLSKLQDMTRLGLVQDGFTLAALALLLTR
ncbi:MAG: NUDIX hydrolase [Planctomycetota bacterium]|nr:MAG: NUDIX hydrolase [Planctomycetota bacterium]